MEKRAAVLFGGLLFFFCIAAGRLFFLFTGGGQALTMGYQSTGYEVVLYRHRGAVYDCNLRRLTENGVQYRALVEPAKLTEDSLLTLAESGVFTPSKEDKAADDPRTAYVTRLAESGKPFAMTVKERIEAEGVTVYTFQKRYDGAFAAHVIGYLDGAGRGVLGIEKACESLLSTGVVSRAIFETDAARKPLVGSGYTLEYNVSEEPDGVVLTLDRDIQRIAEAAADKRIAKGSALVVECETGHIKAMVSRPAFNPENVLEKLSDYKDGELLNNVLLPFNAGSAFKIVTASAALEAGLSKKFTATCHGYYDTGSNLLRCYNSTKHGLLGFAEAFAVSCNAFFCEVSARVGAPCVHDMAKRMGFGSGMVLYEGKAADGSGGIASSPGNLTSLRDLSAPAALANFTIGQGSLLVTPVQMAQLANIIATGGYYRKLSLVKGEVLGGEFKSTVLARSREQILATETAAAVKDYLVYAAEEGTGRLAVPRYASAAVKTSTAEAVDKGRKTRHVWAVGFFPAEAPRYTICVQIVGGNSGEYTAAPVFREIADGILELEKAREGNAQKKGA
mgnify:CR=1 FL=1